MYDTIKVRSDWLDTATMEGIESKLVTRKWLENRTGEVLLELCSGELCGSYDNRWSVRCTREPSIRGGGYIELEGSVHKAARGHNVAGSPMVFTGMGGWQSPEPESVVGILNSVCGSLHAGLSVSGSWEVLRVDVARVYDLPNVQEYLSGWSSGASERRRMIVYEGECVYFPSRNCTVKMYDKGKEFRVHDRNKLISKGWPVDAVDRLGELARGLLRVEVGIRSRYLKSSGLGNKVSEMSDCELVRIWSEQVERCVGVGCIVPGEVRDRLIQRYHTAGVYAWGTWLDISVRGCRAVRKSMSRSTYYRHRRMMREVGVGVVGGNYVSQRNFVPTWESECVLSELSEKAKAIENIRKVA